MLEALKTWDPASVGPFTLPGVLGNGGFWRVCRIDTAAGLTGVSCAPSGFCAAVDSGGNACTHQTK